jgi:hypothetical protein
MPMRYLVGLILFPIAAALVWAALARRLRYRDTSAEDALDGNRSLLILRHVMPPIILVALVYAGIKTVFAYHVMGGQAYLSLFDLAGALAVLAAYGFWLITRTRFRPAIAARQPTTDRTAPALRIVMAGAEEAPADVDRAADLARAALDPGPGRRLGAVGAPLAAPGEARGGAAGRAAGRRASA